MNDINDLEYDLAHDIVQEEIAKYIDIAYRTFCAGVGSIGDEPAQRKAAEQIRHLHLAEPWLPASEITRRLREAGLVAGQADGMTTTATQRSTE